MNVFNHIHEIDALKYFKIQSLSIYNTTETWFVIVWRGMSLIYCTYMMGNGVAKITRKRAKVAFMM